MSEIEYEFDFTVTVTGEFDDPTTGSDSTDVDGSCSDDPWTFEPVDPGFYLQPDFPEENSCLTSPGFVDDSVFELEPTMESLVEPQPVFPSDPSGYFPVDDVVGDVLGQTAPILQDVDDTVDWINEDPSRGWVGDAPWTDPQQGVLAPVLGDTGQLGQIIGGVLDDPNAPLDPGDAEWVGHETELNGYWNTVLGGVEDGFEMQQRAIDDLQRGNDNVALQNRINELYGVITGNANEVNSWPNVDGGYGLTYAPYPWPNY